MNGEINVSEKEKKWLERLAAGVPTEDVAKEMGMKPGTFAYKLNILRSKLGCENMAALIAYSVRNKIID